jgi:hypothetical protein
MSSPTYPIANAEFQTSSDFNQLPLLSTGIEVVSRPGLAASGEGVLLRGTIMKIDPLTGNVTKPVVAADCNCVLSDQVDATSGAAPCEVYIHAKVKADALVFPALPIGSVTDALRNYGIYVESVLGVNGSMAEAGPVPFEAARAERAKQEAAKAEHARADQKAHDHGKQEHEHEKGKK